jgi:NAD(P)-dependent dehydrogenase (short-subunit alcohol dehydrogenase family)
MSLITTPFDFHSTAGEVLRGIDLRGKRVVVTGGAAGIGLATARALASAGASVMLAVRRPAEAASVVEEMRRATGCSGISAAFLDLADLRSVKAFAEEWRGPLHILVNNAGIMAEPDRRETAQGFELQFGTNFLATSLSRSGCTQRWLLRTAREWYR